MRTAQKTLDFLPSVWIRANAGSGKTGALVSRVLALLLQGVAPERIYGITYTKAAASEMRERILLELQSILMMDDATCQARIEALLSRAPTAEEVARARTLFAQVLDSPAGGVMLTTIHGFCQQILSGFPLEAGVPPLFRVLDEAERETFQRTARLNLFDIRESGPLAQALALIAERCGESRMETLLDTVDAQAHQWNACARHLHSGTMRAAIYEGLGLPPEGTSPDNSLETWLLSDATARVIAAIIELLQQHKNKTEQALGSLLAQWLEHRDAQALDALIDHCVTKEGLPSKRAFGKTAPNATWLEELCQRCADCVQLRARIACAEESSAFAEIAFAYRALMQQVKFAEQALDYQDLIDHTHALFTTRAMIGWVMHKLDHRIDHLLIDEAQDTSPAQWSIARALVDELVAGEADSGPAHLPRSVLVVGDEKQSIYSFQGASLQHFHAAEIAFEQLLAAHGSSLTRRQLEISYRSAPAILRLVDAVAQQPHLARALHADGAMHPHYAYRTKARGTVVLHPLIAPVDPEKPPAFTLPRSYPSLTSVVQKLAEAIGEKVADLLATPQEHGAAATPGDILILVRKRRPLAPAIIRALERRGIPVTGLDRLMLSRHLAVRDLLALMAWCSWPEDDLALAQVLRSPIVGISDAQLRAWAVYRPGTLWQQVQAHDGAIATLLEELQNLQHLNPYAFLTQVLEVRGIRRRFAERFGEEVHEILDALKMQSAHLPASLTPSIAWFTDWMRRSDRVIKREGEGRSSRVRIMTVHGAKGLEAPIVILADTLELPDLRKESVYFAQTTAQGEDLPPIPLVALSPQAKQAPLWHRVKEARREALLQEYQRLLYVALTRARDTLHVYGCGSRSPADAASRCWYDSVEAALHSLEGTQPTEDGGLELRDTP